VIDMGFLKVIKTWALREKMPIREIARRTGIARNTIKKYLREGIVEPAFQVPARPSKLDPYAAQLTGWLVSDQRKSRKECRTAKLMHADLVKLGYDGSYERVAAFVREWKGERQRAYQTTDRGTFVPLVFAPGEAFQFDWSEDWAYVGGERIKLQVAHIKLSHSRAFLVRAYLLQTHDPLVTFPAEMRCRATGSIADVWEAEKPAQMPLPTMFDGFVEERKRVSPTRCPAAQACMRERGSDQL
jgi:transposase